MEGGEASQGTKNFGKFFNTLQINSDKENMQNPNLEG
jgi:hypothetical protein